MYNVIIIGGGAVGLYLAEKFAEKNNRVLVLEKRREVGKKPCSGLVSTKIFDFIDEKNRGFVENVFSRARIWLERICFDFHGRAVLLNRHKLDKYLLKKAGESGVIIKTGREVIKIEEGERCVDLFLKSGEKFQGKIIAGCDGATSKVAQDLNLPRQEVFFLGIIGYQLEKPQGNLKNNFPELFFSKRFPGFFAWRIPRLKNIEWGIALLPKDKPREKLRFFLEERGVKIERIESALIPLSPRKKIVTKRCFLCGDAAGQIKPATGGGLIYGLWAAKIASEVIDPDNPLPFLYEREWRESFQKEIFLGSLLRKSYSLPTFLKKIGLSWLQNKENLDQDRPSTMFFC